LANGTAVQSFTQLLRETVAI